MKLVRLLSFYACVVAALAAGGCGYTVPPPPPPAVGGDQPKLVTDLSALSAEPVNPLHTELRQATDHALATPSNPNSPVIYQATPGLVRQAGDDQHPGEQQLLNDKAAKFANFTQVLLDRLYARIALAERTDEISAVRISTDNKAVIITAVLDKKGKLTELIVEQHSGKAIMDKMVLDACKKAIYYNNPPAGAATADGTYKLTIKAKFETYASLDQRHFSFITRLGIGIQ
jgi:hypothetical protein